jgi:hypothetical protein
MFNKIILGCVLFVSVYKSVQNDEATQENPKVCKKFTFLIFKVRSVFEEFFWGLWILEYAERKLPSEVGIWLPIDAV